MGEEVLRRYGSTRNSRRIAESLNVDALADRNPSLNRKPVADARRMALQTIRTDHYNQQNLGDDVSFVRAVTAPHALSEVRVTFEDGALSPTGATLVFAWGPGARSTCLAASTGVPVKLGAVTTSGVAGVVAELFSTPAAVFVLPGGSPDVVGCEWVSHVLATLEPSAIVAVSCETSARSPGVSGIAAGIALGKSVPELPPPELLAGVAAAAVTLSRAPAVALRSLAPLAELAEPAACSLLYSALHDTLAHTSAGIWLASPEQFRRQLLEQLRREPRSSKRAVQAMFA